MIEGRTTAKKSRGKAQRKSNILLPFGSFATPIFTEKWPGIFFSTESIWAWKNELSIAKSNLRIAENERGRTLGERISNFFPGQPAHEVRCRGAFHDLRKLHPTAGEVLQDVTEEIQKRWAY